MLISITERCRMGCSHCMDDARADSEKFMTREMFEKAIEFAITHDIFIGITGGEPTEHPQFWDYMNILVNKLPNRYGVTVFTNGMNITDADIDRIYDLNKRCEAKNSKLLWQVTADKRFYPKKIDKYQKWLKLDGVQLDTKLNKISYYGRARNHSEWKFNDKAPQCFNIRSSVRSWKNIDMAIVTLRQSLKFCTPQISYDGGIKLGESTLCPVVAHIDDNETEIVKKMCNFKCQGCMTILNKLPDNYKEAIGEL